MWPTPPAPTTLFYTNSIVRSTIPDWWFWYHILSFTSYQWMGLMQNNFGDNPNAKLNGQHILDFYSIPDYNPWVYTGFTAIFAFVVFILALLALKYKRIEER